MADISGLWVTQSGAVYQFLPENGYIVATYHQPNADQLAAGINVGDLAYKATLLGNVLVGVFHQRFPLTARTRCPGAWVHESSLYLQISDAADMLTGTLLMEHLPDDSCHYDDRRLVTLVFERVTNEALKASKPAKRSSSPAKGYPSAG